MNQVVETSLGKNQVFKWIANDKVEVIIESDLPLLTILKKIQTAFIFMNASGRYLNDRAESLIKLLKLENTVQQKIGEMTSCIDKMFNDRYAFKKMQNKVHPIHKMMINNDVAKLDIYIIFLNTDDDIITDYANYVIQNKRRNQQFIVDHLVNVFS